ncbi:MAG: aldose 1-epimerase, partial [Planctomycetia bacterium]|nr:aldose 1-epimerase [Planctomycetia bacterium]
IHGFVMSRPWRVIDQADNQLSGEFHAWRDDPSLMERWPADFKFTAIYTLLGNTLDGHYIIENPGDTPLPCGFGTHPYFRVPLGKNMSGGENMCGKADECIVKLPVQERWELKEMLPTGRRIKLKKAKEFQAGQRYGDLKLDDVFTDLQFDGDWCQSSIHDPASGRTITQRCDSTFRECVVYTPPHREAICIEPLTCAPSSFELTRQKIDAGLRTIAPSESITARVQISVS